MATILPTTTLDFNNIQGDILGGLPKRTETFFLFEIINATKFRKDLNKLIPLVKTVAGVLKDRKDIEDHRKKRLPGLLRLTGVNISFSHLGFIKLGIDDSSLRPPVDPHAGVLDPFELGQKIDAVINLGDPTKHNGDPDWDESFLRGHIHGVIVITGDSHASVNKKKSEIEVIFGAHTPNASLKEITSIRGDVRPGDQAAHEHFGFLDGISNPAVIGFDTVINPGPRPVNPGVLVTGHPGDPFEIGRADWAKDGSFLAFRYLFQKAPEFNTFLKKHPISEDGNGKVLTPEEGSELLGARMFGRWKSGAPIDITPFKDDPILAADSKRNNNFAFEGERSSQFKCPFAAHIRKTNPRDDLEVPPTGTGSVEANRIMRRGIQFGPELTTHEKAMGITEHGRGVLFACYQSSLVNGFQLQQQTWSNNPKFPPFTGKPNELPGLDPIIGQGSRSMSGLDPLNPEAQLALPNFVVPRGGEYFFAPSLHGLKGTIAART
ncbi:hypothetical protein HYPSUDRAFT_147511 [Hypholoma sublateritium FD-334 SS-4]|uniref:DyP dimeric alpha+beta barrel domain-containing protein n=1 Tax=Hypholoma sublateritium (strain FD-334 SS-4) TaxID=945553 RepID=A0A0D2P8B1_HYPSF|nr:hypothetical protein HYPSUDRAFT_147511 [Hypholoma sublateritium FD-334 SS-4]